MSGDEKCDGYSKENYCVRFFKECLKKTDTEKVSEIEVNTFKGPTEKGNEKGIKGMETSIIDSFGSARKKAKGKDVIETRKRCSNPVKPVRVATNATHHLM